MKYENGTWVHSTLEEGNDFIITNKYGKKFHFKVATFPVPSGLLSEAIEVITNSDQEPYMFSILSDFDSDTEKSELKLKSKIKRGINRVHLIKVDGRTTIGDLQELQGRIDIGPSLSTSERVFVIDGQRISIGHFVEILEEWNGWNFTFKIVDPTEDY